MPKLVAYFLVEAKISCMVALAATSHINQFGAKFGHEIKIKIKNIPKQTETVTHTPPQGNGANITCCALIAENEANPA